MTDGQPTSAVVDLQRRNIHRDAGDGTGEWSDIQYDDNSLYEDRSGSQARTTFFHWDPDFEGDRDKWRRLSQKNHSKGEDGQSKRKWHAGKRNDAKLFCDHLDLDRDQQDKVLEMTDDIDFNQFGTYTTEQVLVGICSLVVDETTTNFEDRIITRDEFKELMEVVGIGSKEHNRIRRGIRDRTSYF